MTCEDTYACAVLVRNVAVLEREIDLFLKFGGQLVVAIDHVSITSACLDQIFNLLRSNASPGMISMQVTGTRQTSKRTNDGIAS